MKVEKKLVESKLKMEVMILREAAGRKSLRFCTCFDAGPYKDTFYMVMDLVGRSLYEIRKHLKAMKFSMGCAISVATETLKALEELHHMGFIHR